MTYQPPPNDHTAWQGQPPPTQQFAYPPPPAAPPRRKLGTGAIIGIVAGALVLACCGITGIAAIFGDETQPEAKSSPATAAVAERVPPPVEPTPEPTTAAPTTPAPATTTAPAPTAPAAPPAPAKLVMPNVKGMNAAVADDKLRKLGFTNIQYGSQDENDTLVLMLANWTVTKQSAKAGSKMLPDDLIVVTCTKEG
ncbi:PASTA domain-containing protein [Micromonospora sp. NPDC001898]|uniref:PASTA domain-containing protein n=1 Tax=Micromonospora sp. NPDC001898 TaxID=3364221 RepID=UPI0036743367